MTKSDDAWDWPAIDKSDEKVSKTVRPPAREEVLRSAIEAVTKQRNNQYGPPTQDFERTANLWTQLGFRFDPYNDGGAVEAQHVAMAMILLKLSRATWSPEHQDNWIDMAGYAACGWECVE